MKTEKIISWMLLFMTSSIAYAQNTGIGTVTPTEKLEVNGNIKGDTLKANYIKISLNAGASKVLTSDANGVATWQSPGGGGSGWSLTGNGGTSPTTNFLGTTDATVLAFKVNNKPSGRIDYASSKAETSFGYQALKQNVAAGNTAFGYLSMSANASGYANTAAGQYSMNKNAGGFSNTAFGSEALVRIFQGILIQL